MKIAYLILAHTNLDQLSLLIELLTTGTDNYCFIHLDAKLNKAAAINLLKERNAAGRYSIIQRSVDIKWGGYSMIEATLALLHIAIKDDADFDYFSLHSGMDMPLRSNEYITNYFNQNRLPFFLEYYKLPNYKKWPKEDGGNRRVKYYWFADNFGANLSHILINIQKKMGVARSLRNKMEVFGGSQWWTISRACAVYVLEYVNNNKWFCRFFKYSLVPDELFFNTIIANSTFVDQGLNNNLRFIEWEISASHPKVFSNPDFENIIAGNALYARKFDMRYDIKIFSRIIANINNKGDRMFKAPKYTEK